MEKTTKFNRREFLGIAGATAASIGLGGMARLPLAPAAVIPHDWLNRTEEFIPSICRLCPGGCGVRLRVVDGMPVQVMGNPLHPVNAGALCPRGLAGLQSLYNPDRLTQPLRRLGPKGSDRWETISWEEALDAVATAMADLRHRTTPEALVIMGGEYRGATDWLWKRFADAFGTPNYLRLRTFTPELPGLVAALMHGASEPIAYDLPGASLVLSFGCNWLESWHSPVFQMRAYGAMRQDHRGRRAEILHVDSRLSHTAAKADLWIPITPGTEGVLALGLAHVILREQIYDEEFVANNTFGFEDWQSADGQTVTGFKRLVWDEYTPVRVSEITGVRPETLVTVARKFASIRPAIALCDNSSMLEGHDLFTRMAIHSLNALVGCIGIAGGVLPGTGESLQPPWLAVVPDAIAEQGLAHSRVDGAGRSERFLDVDVPRGLHESVLRSPSVPVELLLLHRVNPLYGRADKHDFRKALEKIPLVVSFSNIPDETCPYADLVLPEHHFYEGWQDDVIGHLPGFTLFGVSQPVIEPLYNTRHVGDAILDIAARLGDPIAAAFPWTSYEQVVQSVAQGLFDSGRGYVASTPSHELFRTMLRSQGYRAPESETFEEFWETLQESGAWWDPVEPLENSRRRFATPSEKFEFYPQLLETRLERAAISGAPTEHVAPEERRRILTALGLELNDQNLFFPRVLLAGHEDAEPEFPFLLQTYELLTLGSGVGAGLPWLQENLTAHLDENWDSWIELHPKPAQDMSIRDGDWVWVRSANGRARIRARICAGMRPDVVAMPVGQGHTANGRWAQNRGVDPSDLVVAMTEPGEGFGIRKRTHVGIEKA